MYALTIKYFNKYRILGELQERISYTLDKSLPYFPLYVCVQ